MKIEIFLENCRKSFGLSILYYFSKGKGKPVYRQVDASRRVTFSNNGSPNADD